MEALVQLAFIIAGLVCLIVGIVKSIIVLIVVGIILLAIGGVWVFFVSFDGGGSGGGSFFDFD